ncbi:MAG: ribonuclease III [Treponema sp.]|jgi:ribonuclease-3|nr:ribonuclease III [Treponema sp.]
MYLRNVFTGAQAGAPGYNPLDWNFNEPEPERRKELQAFLKYAGIKFRNLGLLNLSFVHRSVSNESQYRGNNERLEFLGDAVLGAVCATVLYERFGGESEGELAKIKSIVVSEDILSGLARELQIDALLILGKGEDLSGGRKKNAILADALEALFGALYLDSGFSAAFSFVERCISPEISRVVEKDYHADHKSLLQELCQRYFKMYPQYRLINRSGPEHERLFRMEVWIKDRVYGPGLGRSKKTAEQEAARVALERLKDEFGTLC